jgi:hypothetical protein
MELESDKKVISGGAKEVHYKCVDAEENKNFHNCK